MHFQPIILLCLVLLVIAAALSAATVLAMAVMLLKPTRMGDGKALYVLRRLNPLDLNLPYDEVGFDVEDAHSHRHITLAGWWIPATLNDSPRTVILVHGYGDAKVGAIAWAPLFRELGFHILAIDLRAHGQSGGTMTTAGYHERYDLQQVIRQLRDMHLRATSRLVLFGVSLGAAVVAATAAEGTDGIDAIILECPFDDFLSAAASHGRKMALPLVNFQPMAATLAQKIANVDFSSVAPVRTLPHVACPVMVIHDLADPFVTRPHIDAINHALTRRLSHLPPAEIWEVPEAYHAMGLPTAPIEYENRLRAFLTGAGVIPNQLPLVGQTQRAMVPLVAQPITDEAHAPQPIVTETVTANQAASEPANIQSIGSDSDSEKPANQDPARPGPDESRNGSGDLS